MYSTKSGAELGVKRIASELGVKRSLAREIVARACGYRDWHHLTTLIGKPSAPTMPEEHEALAEYLAEQGLSHLQPETVLAILSPEQEMRDQLRIAEDHAWSAQYAYESGDDDVGARHTETALRHDPLCTHALLQKASRIEGLEDRLPLLRRALEGAAREVVSDQDHLLQRMKSHEEAVRRNWGGRIDDDDADDLDVFARPTENGSYQDRWPELSMRDYVRALYSLGETLVRLERPAEAALCLRELCSQSPGNRFESKAWLCAAHIQMGDVRGAERIAAIDTGENMRWGPKVVALCSLARGETTPAEFAAAHPFFSREIARLSAVPAPGAEMEDDGRDGYAIHELDAGLTPEWARALACGVRRQPGLLDAVLAAARRA